MDIIVYSFKKGSLIPEFEASSYMTPKAGAEIYKETI